LCRAAASHARWVPSGDARAKLHAEALRAWYD